MTEQTMTTCQCGCGTAVETPAPGQAAAPCGCGCGTTAQQPVRETVPTGACGCGTEGGAGATEGSQAAGEACTCGCCDPVSA